MIEANPRVNIQDTLAPEEHKQGPQSKDMTAGHHHGNKAKKMEVAWASYQEKPRYHNTNCIKVDTGLSGRRKRGRPRET